MRGSPRIAFCAYPWDLPDSRSAEEAAATGADGVAIAAAYHAVRAATPRAAIHRVVEADAALHVPVRAEAWADLALRPRPLAAEPEGAGFGRAAAAARSAGLAVEAWVVLTHSGVVGAAHPEHVARSAFGDPYPYALCPSSPAVVEYAARLVREVVVLGEVEALMVEACGPMGVGHLGAHEKTAGADWSAVDEALLSLCFCTHCRAALEAEGVDSVEAAERVRGAVGGAAANPDEALGELAAPVLSVRDAARRGLLSAVDVSARAAGARTLRYHAQPDPWATGPFAALMGEPLIADGAIAIGDALIRDAAAVRAAVDGAPLGGYFAALPPETPASMLARWPQVMRALDDVYLYHLGLVSAERLEALTAVISAVRADD